MFLKNKNFIQYLSQVFCLDLRSLSLFRIGLGLTILYNLYSIYPNLDAFYGPHGVAPLYAIKSELNWSLYAISDNFYFLRTFFILHVVFAIMLIVGFRTRLATILCLIMTVSLIHRAPILSYGADKIVKVFLMWGAFLPLGAYFSFDHRKNNLPDQFFSMATIAFICQLIIIYTFNAMTKTHQSWSQDFTALQYVFSSHDLAKPLATWFLQFPELLKCLTFLSLCLEHYGGFLLLIPFFSSLFRSVVIVMFIAYHAFIYSTIDVGWFSVIMVCVWVALIPSTWWQKFDIRRNKNNLSGIKFRWSSGLVVGMILMYLFVLHYRYFKIHVFHNGWKENQIEAFGKQTGLYQKWSMFAPAPPLFSRKYSLLPIYAQNSRVLISTPIQINVKDRWSDLLYQIQRDEFKKYKAYVEAYYTYRWNQEHPEEQQVKTINIFYEDEAIIIE